MDMGQKIKLLREQKGMTLEELGNKVGVGKSTVRKWETGLIANMRRDKISKIAKALEVEPSYLMGWEDKDAPAISNKENPSAPQSLAAHFDGDEYTEEELEEIRRFAEFVKNKRG